MHRAAVDVVTSGEKAIVWSIIGSALGIGVLVFALVGPLRNDLRDHEQLWTHAGSAQVFIRLESSIDDLKEEIRLLRQENMIRSHSGSQDGGDQ